MVQGPLWVLVADELRAPGRAVEAYGIQAPARAWSDDYTIPVATETALRDLLRVFGAICEDLCIPC